MVQAQSGRRNAETSHNRARLSSRSGAAVAGTRGFNTHAVGQRAAAANRRPKFRIESEILSTSL